VDFVEMLSQDRNDFLKGAEQHLVEFRLTESPLQRFFLASPLGDLEPEGQAEQSLGLEQRTEGPGREVSSAVDGLKSSFV
jgi:hypothetical protein